MSTRAIFSAITKRLDGKVALITGGGADGKVAVIFIFSNPDHKTVCFHLCSNLSAKLFSKRGAKVVVADIQDDLGRSLCNDISKTSGSATYVHCNVTNEAQVSKAVDTAVTKYGKLDIIFNNAGVIDDQKPRIADIEKSDFERILGIDVIGVFLCTKHAARVMIPARSGSIISTASVSSVVAGAGSHVYCCSKHAVAGFTKNAAMEMGQFGIRVNCLSPYLIATPLVKEHSKLDEDTIAETSIAVGNLKGVTHTAEDIAQGALYFVSDDSKYVSGHNLVIDGGFTIGNPAFDRFSCPMSSM